ncbi:MAG: hypothetical protein CVV41_17545 [Candidatus Riflebacteria bacterium HGW-Riflebacteria-1]|jgi:outer membrane protein OmpA-like peptidoglycan-associated protein|nr:MAG: hypothetical protein CVV41_17545 [Candidatus Riflebacteria bacterium HGW-Riflebacteria-1]
MNTPVQSRSRFSLRLTAVILLFLCISASICEAKSYKAIIGYENEVMEIPLVPGRVISTKAKTPSPDSPQMNTVFPVSDNIPTVVPAVTPEPAPETLVAIEDVVPQMEDGFPETTVIPTPESLQATIDATGRAIVNGINFEFDSANLADESLASLNAVLGYLRNNPDVRIAIEGHCDTSGDTSLNPALSQARADAVRDWMIERGVDSWRIRAVGMSHTKPIADNATAEGQARNRRVELVKE